MFDWALASEVPTGEKVIIAGGLDSTNVIQAIAQTHCWGVDVASGVERAPGHKDPIKLREFIQAALTGFASSDEADRPADVSSDLYDWQEEG